MNDLQKFLLAYVTFIVVDSPCVVGIQWQVFF